MKLKYITEPLEKFVSRRKNADKNYTITTIHCPLCNEPSLKREFEEHVLRKHSSRVDECFARLFGIHWPARCACGHELKYSRQHKGFPTVCGACQTGTVSKLEYKSSDEADKAIEQLKAMLDKAKEEKKRLETEEKLQYARRALWIARAKRALEKIAWFKLWNSSISTMNPEDGARQEYDKWKKVLGKFLKKAEEYK